MIAQCPALAKILEKQKLRFFRRALLHKKSRVCLKYLVHGCSCGEVAVKTSGLIAGQLSLYNIMNQAVTINQTIAPLPPHDETHLDEMRGLISPRGFGPSALTSRARWSDTTPSDKDKQIRFMLMPRTRFKVEEFRLEQSPYLQYLFVTCRLQPRTDLYPISIYIIFSWGTLYHIVFSPASCRLDFCLWR